MASAITGRSLLMTAGATALAARAVATYIRPAEWKHSQPGAVSCSDPAHIGCSHTVQAKDPRPTKWNGYVPRPNEFEELFQRNRKWAEGIESGAPEYSSFKNMPKVNKPKFLWIGCSDSRMPMRVLGAGEMFVHRNVANLVINNDINILAVLEYALNVLQIPDIIICGHYGCGGVAASTKKLDHGLVEHWIASVRDTQRLHKAELDLIPEEDKRLDRLVELNVVEQCVNLLKNPIVQHCQFLHGYPRVHPMVFDFRDGLLRPLDKSLGSKIAENKDVYSLYDFDNRDGKRAVASEELVLPPSKFRL